MTTLANRPNTALLVIDVQNGVVKNAYARDAIVANIAAVVEKARAARVPVVWVQHVGDHSEDRTAKRGGSCPSLIRARPNRFRQDVG